MYKLGKLDAALVLFIKKKVKFKFPIKIKKKK